MAGVRGRAGVGVPTWVSCKHGLRTHTACPARRPYAPAPCTAPALELAALTNLSRHSDAHVVGSTRTPHPLNCTPYNQRVRPTNWHAAPALSLSLRVGCTSFISQSIPSKDSYVVYFVFFNRATPHCLLRPFFPMILQQRCALCHETFGLRLRSMILCGSQLMLLTSERQIFAYRRLLETMTTPLLYYVLRLLSTSVADLPRIQFVYLFPPALVNSALYA